MADVSFASDIMPLFAQYAPQMRWRLDLTSYDDVRANADIIYRQIHTKQMPPAPFPPLSGEQIATFKTWMETGFKA